MSEEDGTQNEGDGAEAVDADTEHEIEGLMRENRLDPPAISDERKRKIKKLMVN